MRPVSQTKTQSSSLHQYMMNIYTYMGLGLGLSAVCAFLIAFGSAIAVRVTLRLALDQLDEDKDGSVSWEEATGVVTKLPGRAWRLMTSKDQIDQQPQSQLKKKVVPE